MKKFLTTFLLVIISVFYAVSVLAKGGESVMDLNELKNKDSVLNYFIELAQIPSPSLKEEKVAQKIIQILNDNGIENRRDDYGNIFAVLPNNNSANPPLILSSHMDVVGGDEAVNIRISQDGKYLETDKTRSLGADDKAGIAIILDVITYLKKNPQISHPKIEVTFTRDEESGLTGIKNLDTTQLEGVNALILDGEYLGECDVEGAGFTNLTIQISGGKGGHSGNDIHDKTRVSANKVLAQIVAEIPQGVFKRNSKGTITSLNSGAIIGGTAGMYIRGHKDDLNNLNEYEIMKNVSDDAYRNIIASNAYVSYSIRSSEPENEAKLNKKITKILEKYSKKYENALKIEYKFEEHLKPFVKDNNEELLKIVFNAAKENGIESKPVCVHAGAETHVLQNDKLNKNNEKFKPLLLGIANISNMHSNNESLEFETLIKGRDWILSIVSSK